MTEHLAWASSDWASWQRNISGPGSRMRSAHLGAVVQMNLCEVSAIPQVGQSCIRHLLVMVEIHGRKFKRPAGQIANRPDCSRPTFFID